MNWKKIAWAAVVLLVVYFHLLVGTLLAIATAFYWLLEHHLIGDEERLIEMAQCCWGDPLCTPTE
jgi:uncharacterized membrane protein